MELDTENVISVEHRTLTTSRQSYVSPNFVFRTISLLSFKSTARPNIIFLFESPGFRRGRSCPSSFEMIRLIWISHLCVARQTG
jgi:hypothetical protein